MPCQILEEFEVESFHAAAVAEAYAVPQWAYSVNEARAFEDESEGLYLSGVDGFRCAKGVMVALTLEAGAALCFYGMWHLWHMLR
ncbi:MAG: hypothetical protein ABSE87_06240 [Terracidiphilus sp.]|jgi:hypothetical protein